MTAMVFKEAAMKTGAYLLLALLLSFAVLTFIAGDIQPTGRVTSIGTATQDTGSWVIFFLGIFIGVLITAAYFYIVHLENRKED